MQIECPSTYAPNRYGEILYNIWKVLRGHVSFGFPNPINNAIGDNISGQWKTGVTPGVADTEFAVPHNLGIIPLGYLVVSVNGGILYKSTVTAWTTTNIYLKCSTTNITYTIFILGA